MGPCPQCHWRGCNNDRYGGGGGCSFDHEPDSENVGPSGPESDCETADESDVVRDDVNGCEGDRDRSSDDYSES